MENHLVKPSFFSTWKYLLHDLEGKTIWKQPLTKIRKELRSVHFCHVLCCSKGNRPAPLSSCPARRICPPRLQGDNSSPVTILYLFWLILPVFLQHYQWHIRIISSPKWTSSYTIFLWGFSSCTLLFPESLDWQIWKSRCSIMSQCAEDKDF